MHRKARSSPYKRLFNNEANRPKIYKQNPFKKPSRTNQPNPAINKLKGEIKNCASVCKIC